MQIISVLNLLAPTDRQCGNSVCPNDLGGKKGWAQCLSSTHLCILHISDLNGAYSSLFQLPTYTSAAAPTSTKSTASSSHDKHSHTKTSKSDPSAAAGSTPLSPPPKRSASPASSTSSQSSTSRHKEGSSSSSKSSKNRDSPKMNGPGAAAISKYDEEVAKSLNSMFAFPDTSAAMLAPSMFSAPPMFSYPYGAGALFAAHHASLFGLPMGAGHPTMPYPAMAAMSPPPSSIVTSHSTTSPKGVSSSSSSSVTKTTTAKTTAVSSAVSKSTTPTGTSVSSSHKVSSDSDRKSRKNLFGGEPHHSRPEGQQSSSAAARTSEHQPKAHHKDRPTNHSSRRVSKELMVQQIHCIINSWSKLQIKPSRTVHQELLIG